MRIEQPEENEPGEMPGSFSSDVTVQILFLDVAAVCIACDAVVVDPVPLAAGSCREHDTGLAFRNLADHIVLCRLRIDRQIACRSLDRADPGFRLRILALNGRHILVPLLYGQMV